MDMHLIFDQVGEKVGLVPGQTVAGAFCTLWAQTYQNEAAVLIQKAKDAITLFGAKREKK